MGIPVTVQVNVADPCAPVVSVAAGRHLPGLAV